MSAKQFDGHDLNHLTQLWKKWESHHFSRPTHFFLKHFSYQECKDVNSSNTGVTMLPQRKAYDLSNCDCGYPVVLLLK